MAKASTSSSPWPRTTPCRADGVDPAELDAANLRRPDVEHVAPRASHALVALHPPAVVRPVVAVDGPISRAVVLADLGLVPRHWLGVDPGLALEAVGGVRVAVV